VNAAGGSSFDPLWSLSSSLLFAVRRLSHAPGTLDLAPVLHLDLRSSAPPLPLLPVFGSTCIHPKSAVQSRELPTAFSPVETCQGPKMAVDWLTAER
jgi:hypothetical protein